MQGRLTQAQAFELEIKNQMADSIGEFVLQHSEITDPIVGYNVWRDRVARYRNYPNSHELTLFCLDVFDSCLNDLTRDEISYCLALNRRLYQAQCRREYVNHLTHQSIE